MKAPRVFKLSPLPHFTKFSHRWYGYSTLLGAVAAGVRRTVSARSGVTVSGLCMPLPM